MIVPVKTACITEGQLTIFGNECVELKLAHFEIKPP